MNSQGIMGLKRKTASFKMLSVLNAKGKEVRGGHADTKKDREIKKDMRGDEKEEHEASYTRQRVLFLKKRASGLSGWI